MEEQISDEDLMLLYREGDAHAFEKLYLRNKDALYRFMLSLCGNESITEELFQDVWLKLVNARQRYQVTASFRTYLFQIARNRVIDHYRSSTRNPQAGAFSNGDVIAELPADRHSRPDIQAETNQAMQSLLQAVDALPLEQREAFLLKEEAGLSVQEIANLTGVNSETAKSRLRYAFKKIRGEMVNDHE